jgi:hypothetical protein
MNAKLDYAQTPAAKQKRKRSLSATLNDPEWRPSDAQRAVKEKKRRAQWKRKTAEILRRTK